MEKIFWAYICIFEQFSQHLSISPGLIKQRYRSDEALKRPNNPVQQTLHPVTTAKNLSFTPC